MSDFLGSKRSDLGLEKDVEERSIGTVSEKEESIFSSGISIVTDLLGVEVFTGVLNFKCCSIAEILSSRRSARALIEENSCLITLNCKAASFKAASSRFSTSGVRTDAGVEEEGEPLGA